jgi:predicted phage terminase large subunit-like protein
MLCDAVIVLDKDTQEYYNDDKGIAVIRWSSRDNKFVTPDYLKAAEQQYSTLVQAQNIDGIYVDIYEHGIFHDEWWQSFETPPDPELKIISVDPAFSQGKNDFTVIQVWYLKDNHYYLVREYHEQADYPQWKRTLKTWADEFKPDYILVEDNQAQGIIVHNLREDSIAAKGVTSTIKLDARASRETATVESGLVHIHKDILTEDWLMEFNQFPNVGHDDRVSCLCQALYEMRNYQAMMVKPKRPLISGRKSEEFYGL